MDKAHVAEVLRNMARLLELRGENPYKVRAYDQGAERIAGLSHDLDTLVRQGKLHELPGIGSSLEQKISELVTTGRLEAYEELLSSFPPNILALRDVPDLGPKKAQVLWDALGVKTLEDLEAACRAHRVRDLKGFGPRSEERILENLEKLKNQQRATLARHLLSQALPAADRLLGQLSQTPGVQRLSVTGPLRRFCETVQGVDLVASSDSPGAVLDALVQASDFAQVQERDARRCRLRGADGLEVTLDVVADAAFAPSLLHLTGSPGHVARLRTRALEKGLLLDEQGLTLEDRAIPLPDEESLYAALDLPFVAPELRDDSGELEAALQGTLPPPDSLVSAGAIRGAVHSHSTWSDGRNTLEEMARAAKARGLEYLTVTEHSQAAAYAGGLTADDLRRQWDEIDRLNAQLAPFRLFKGIEADILESGALDCPPDLLDRLEVVIGSIHLRHKMDEAQMTRRVLAAMDDPHLHILGHLTGRLLLSREPYGLRLDEVFEKAARKGVVIEVNGNPDRLDIKAEHVRRALAHGVKLVASVDAHSTRELAHIRYSVATSRKGWARKEDVLNTLPAQAFLYRLHALRRDGRGH